jgi:PAS domain-containing protein
MKSDARSPHADPEHTDEVDRTASPKRLLIITALGVLLGAVVVLLVHSALPPMPTLVMALAGGALTAVLATPFLYLFLFRPMQQHIQVRRRAEEELDNLNRHLKALVAERTESLAQTNRRLTHEAEELRRTVDSLRRNDEFFQEAVERAPCLILTFDAESQRCSYVNSRVTDLLGYGQDELAVSEETLVNRLVEARDRASFREVVKELVNGPEGQAVSGSCGFIASSGRVVQLRFATTVLSRTPTMEARDILLTATPATV